MLAGIFLKRIGKPFDDQDYLLFNFHGGKNLPPGKYKQQRMWFSSPIQQRIQNVFIFPVSLAHPSLEDIAVYGSLKISFGYAEGDLCGKRSVKLADFPNQAEGWNNAGFAAPDKIFKSFPARQSFCFTKRASQDG